MKYTNTRNMNTSTLSSNDAEVSGVAFVSRGVVLERAVLPEELDEVPKPHGKSIMTGVMEGFQEEKASILDTQGKR